MESLGPVVIRKNLELPEGASNLDDSDDNDALAEDDPHRALGDISLDDIEFNQPYRSNQDVGSSLGHDDSTVPEDLFGAIPKKPKKKKKSKDQDHVLDQDRDLDHDRGHEKKAKKSKKEKKEKKEKKKKKEKSNEDLLLGI